MPSQTLQACMAVLFDPRPILMLEELRNMLGPHGARDCVKLRLPCHHLKDPNCPPVSGGAHASRVRMIRLRLRSLSTPNNQVEYCVPQIPETQMHLREDTSIIQVARLK